MATNAPKMPVPFTMEKKIPLSAFPEVYSITMPPDGYGLRAGIGHDRNRATYHTTQTPRSSMTMNNGIESLQSSIVPSINGSLCPSVLLPGQNYLMALWSGTGYDPAVIAYHQFAYKNVLDPNGVNNIDSVWNSPNNYFIIRLEDTINSGKILNSGDTVHLYAARTQFLTGDGQKKGVLSTSPNIHISRGVCDTNLVTVVKPLAISNVVYKFDFKISSDDIQKKEKFYVNVKAFEGRRYDISLSWCVGNECSAPVNPWIASNTGSTSDAVDYNVQYGSVFSTLLFALFVFAAFS